MKRPDQFCKGWVKLYICKNVSLLLLHINQRQLFRQMFRVIGRKLYPSTPRQDNNPLFHFINRILWQNRKYPLHRIITLSNRSEISAQGDQH